MANLPISGLPAGTPAGKNLLPQEVPTVQTQKITLSQLSSFISSDLGLGTMAFENSNSVSITGGAISGVSLSSSNVTITGGSVSGVTLVASSIQDTALTPAGVVHNDVSGNLTSGLVVGSDIATATITNPKLALMPNNTFKGNVLGTSATPSDVSISDIQTALGLGTMAFQNSNSVSITGGTISGVTFSSSNATITGGSIDGTPIGVMTPSSIAATSLTIPSFSTAGVIHNNASGVFSSSLIVNADITNSTITGSKIAGSTIANSNLSTMPAHTFKGNNTAGAANPIDLTIAQMQAELGVGSAGLTAAQVGFGSGSNLLTGSSNFTWNNSTLVLQMASGTEVNLGNVTSARKLVLYNVANNNFQFYGLGVSPGSLDYQVDSVASNHTFYAGTSTTTKQQVFQITGNKLAITQSGGGIQFGNSTSGYVPATLDSYEDSTVVNMVLSGPWAASQSFPVKLTRLGRFVSMQWVGMSTGVSRTVSSTITSSPTSNNIPARFGTSALAGLTFPIRIIDGSTNSSLDVGAITFSNGAGGLFLTITPAANVPFSNAFCGVPFGAITWQYA